MTATIINRVSNGATWLSGWAEKVAAVLCVLCLAAMFAATTLGVYYRYVLVSPLSWTEEFARYGLIWLAFLSSGIALKKGEHIGIEFFIDRLPKKYMLVNALVIKMLILGFLMVVSIQGFKLMAFIYETGQNTPALGIPTGIVYSAVPIGCTMMLVYLLPMVLDNVSVLVAEFRSPAKANKNRDD